VTPRLGWPAAPPRTAPGLGWPERSDTGADDRTDSTDDAEGPAMDTSPEIDVAVSRETEPSAAPTVSRETSPSVSPLSSVPRASDLVSERVPEHPYAGDRSTPLAQATEHSLAVAAGRPLRRQLPRPDGPRVMVVANQKGGVGKTTTTVNVAAALAQHGLKVLVIDLDPQGNASTALAIEHGEGTPGSYHVLVDGTAMDEVIVECPDVPGLFVVPATIDLAGAEIELVSLVARETRLRKALDAHLAECAEVDASYDYVFIDCPPSLGLLTVNALSAGHEMLIPIQCEYYALEGLSQLLHTIEQIREHLNPRLRVGAIMLTMYDARTRLAAGVADEVREHFGQVVLKTAIPRSVRISEAPSYGQTVLTYDPGSAGALSYLEASAELAHQIAGASSERSGRTEQPDRRLAEPAHALPEENR
jgi:chromosome partitioning protein